MKILYYTDVHWSQHSSIIRSRDEYYSTRLDNLIRSVNWAEEQAAYFGCSSVIIGGDFFDSSQLNAEEVSALQNIRWAPISHVFITGNHETTTSNLEYSTADLFNLCPNSVVINKAEQYIIDSNTEFCFLPYVLERDRKRLIEYFPNRLATQRIIFSHNDLKDVNYGGFISKEGFELNDIDNSCELFINGHIHHCAKVTSKIINGGNLTGQNFTEDASKYDHCALIIDTDNLSVQFIVNPYAFNFYKLDLTNLDNDTAVINKLGTLKHNAVITVTVNQNIAQTVRTILENYNKSLIREYRVIVQHSMSNITEKIQEFDTVDHLKQFENYVLTNIGTSDVVREELSMVMR